MNFAIIGSGVIAFTHAQALTHLPEHTLYAVCDLIPDKADAFAKEYNVSKIYYSYHDLLLDPAVDIVCICVPSGIHGEVAVHAARAGKAMVCEKPMEITPERIDHVIAEVEKAGVKMQCVFQRRLMPTAIAVKEIIASGKLGKICLAEAQLKYYRDQAYYDSAGWRGTWELDGGGALMNQGVHGIDLLLWMLGDQIESVYGRANTLSHEIAVEDTSAAILQMKSGTLCVIEGTTSAYPGFSTTFGIYGEFGTIVFNDEKILEWNFIHPEETPARPDTGDAVGGSQNPGNIGIYGHICLLRDIADAVQFDREPMIPPRDAREAVQVICSIYESARKKAPIFF